MFMPAPKRKPKPSTALARVVVEGEIVDPGTQQHPVRRAAAVARRQTVTLVTHSHTKTAALNAWFLVGGTGVAVRRWRDAHGANRYERMMHAAEIAGDREALLEWEARDVAEKQRRHDRVMDWIYSPVQLIKAIAVSIVAVGILLLGLGVALALATHDISLVIGPISAVIAAIGFTAWFLATYGAVMLVIGTAVGLAYLWHLGRTRAEVPAWFAPVDPTVRQVVPDEGAILNALRELGIPALNRKFKEGWQPRWVSATTRDGKGYHTQLELPLGVTVEMVNDRKDVLAHNLVRKPVEVWPTEPRKMAGVLDLWVADQGVLTDPVEPYPLLTAGTADYFTGVPVGVDQRGDKVIGKLMASNYGIAGIMGSGKTALVINLLLGGMLDPLVDIDVFCMAYNVDYDAMKPRLRTLIKGDEDEHVVAAMDGLRELRSEVSKRGRLLEELGGEETKVTRELAKKDSRLRPRIAVFDECQELFRHEKYGDEAKELAIKVMTKARKCAITLIWITPAPSADSLPRDLAKTTSHGVCFAIGDHQGNDAILGTGAHKQGITATTLVANEDVGTAMASGFASRPGLLRTYYVRKEKGIDEITPIVQRAMALRGKVGISMTKAVLGEARDLLADVLEVMGDQERMRTQDVLQRLVELDRTTYQGWVFERLTAELPDGAKPYKTGGQMQVSASRIREAQVEEGPNLRIV